MKKLFLMMLAVLMALCVTPSLADGIPQEIADLFDVPAWDGYEIARTNTQEEGYALFLADDGVIIDGEPVGLVIVSKGDHNVLCMLQKKKGQWRITGRNHNAIPDGDVIPALYFDLENDAQIVYGSHPLAGVYSLSLAYDGRTMRFSGMAFGMEGWGEALIYEDRIRYNSFHDLEYQGSQTVYGVYDSSFEAFNYRYFPRTPYEADAILTNAPDIPQNQGDPNALKSPVELNLRTGEKYDVFSAPGRSSYRPAGGKAVMSTNDWVQIFGEDNGWVLVQYDISSGQMRFGYVDASVLPRNATVHQLVWADIPCSSVRDTRLTDDPLNSCKTLVTLPEGTQVTALATMGTWTYVETQISGKPARGFIPTADLTPLEPDAGWDSLLPNG